VETIPITKTIGISISFVLCFRLIEGDPAFVSDTSYKETDEGRSQALPVDAVSLTVCR
jgi:hypothetical protein